MQISPPAHGEFGIRPEDVRSRKLAERAGVENENARTDRSRSLALGLHLPDRLSDIRSSTARRTRINTFSVVPSRRMMIVRSPMTRAAGLTEGHDMCQAPADVTDNLASSFAASLSRGQGRMSAPGSKTLPGLRAVPLQAYQGSCQGPLVLPLSGEDERLHHPMPRYKQRTLDVPSGRSSR